MSRPYRDEDTEGIGDDKRTNKRGSVNKKRGKGGKPRFNGKRNDAINDPMWYASTLDLLLTSANLPFSVPVGSAYHWPVGSNIANYHVPGIMRISIMPSIGGTTGDKSATSAINLAAQNIYADIRKENSGGKNYDPVDIMVYLMAYDSIVMYHEFLKRVYGLARLYSQMNWYLGKSILYSMRVDPDSIAANLADFKMGIDMLAARMDMFFVPDAFPLYKRHAYMYQNVYMDDPSVKCQFFYFQPHCFGKYTAINGTKTYGGLEMVTPFTGSNRLTYQELISFGDDMIDAFVKQQDNGIISGDIAKAYNVSGLIHLEPVPFDHTVVPVYVPELLHQIHNAKVLGTPTFSKFVEDDTKYCLIDQDPTTNLLYETAKFPNGYHDGVAEGEVLNLKIDNPTPADVMVSTRLMSIVKDAAGNLGPHGTEIVTAIHIFTLSDDGTLVPTSIPFKTYEYYRTDTSTVAQLKTAINTMAKMSNFAFAPLVTFDFADGAESEKKREFFANINNMRIMSYQDLADLHTVALMGEFGVPPLGKYSPSTTKK